MQVPAGVVYSAFGVTILIAAVLLLRAVTSLRRHFLNFHDGLEWPDGDPARRPSGSTETRLVLNGDPVDQVDDVPLPPPPPRVSLPEWVGGGGGEGAAKRVPPLSLVQLDKACPAAVLAQSTAGGGGDTEGGGEEGSTGEAPPCSVCLDDMEPGQLVRTLPLCGHLYHDVYVWAGGGVRQRRVRWLGATEDWALPCLLLFCFFLSGVPVDQCRCCLRFCYLSPC